MMKNNFNLHKKLKMTTYFYKKLGYNQYSYSLQQSTRKRHRKKKKLKWWRSPPTPSVKRVAPLKMIEGNSAPEILKAV